jgi:hydrogenase maturation protease
MRVVILCIGNLLMLDEGFGPRIAAELLARYDFPGEVEVLDRGVMGMALLSDIRGVDRLLIIDAVDNTGTEAGTILSFKPEDMASVETFHGAHDLRLTDVLQAAALLGEVPTTDCLGVQIADMNPPDYQIGLTPAVEAAVEDMLAQVCRWLEGIGFAPQKRAAPPLRS